MTKHDENSPPRPSAKHDTSPQVSHTGGDTPRTDALLAEINDLHADAQADDLEDLCRQLERELEQSQFIGADLLKELAEAQETTIRWFQAASPYATPGSLARGLAEHRNNSIEECALVCESRAGSQATAAFRILMSAADAIRQLKT